MMKLCWEITRGLTCLPIINLNLKFKPDSSFQFFRVMFFLKLLLPEIRFQELVITYEIFQRLSKLWKYK